MPDVDSRSEGLERVARRVGRSPEEDFHFYLPGPYARHFGGESRVGQGEVAQWPG